MKSSVGENRREDNDSLYGGEGDAGQTIYARKWLLGNSLLYSHRGQKGPCVMVVAGIHGKEIASIRAAEKLVKLLNQQKLRISQGKLIIVPIVNQEAYRKRIRGIPDLNRTFLRKKSS